MFDSPNHLILFENAALQILESAHNYLIIQYKPGKRQLADLLAGFEQLAYLFNAHRWRALLSDQRLMSPLTETENATINEFLTTYFNQRGHGMTVAVLVAQDVFARLTSSQFRSYNHGRPISITYHVFEKEYQALEWLANST